MKTIFLSEGLSSTIRTRLGIGWTPDTRGGNWRIWMETQGLERRHVRHIENTKVLFLRYGEYRKHIRETYASLRRLADGDANFTRASTTPREGV
jgi:hypothetical protein